MTVYNINLGIGWASSGVEYAQAYRGSLFRKIGQPAKFIFTDLILYPNIEYLTKNIGFEDDEIIWLFQYFTDVKIAPTTYTLSEFLTSIPDEPVRQEKNGKVLRYFFENDVFITCYLKEENSEILESAEYVSRGILLKKDFFSYTKYLSEYFIPDNNQIQVYKRTFFNEDGSVAYDMLVNGQEEIYHFPHQFLYGRHELLRYLLESLQLTKSDIVLLDRETGIGQTVFEEAQKAHLGIVVHAEHFGENLTNDDYIYWNNFYDYQFTNANLVDFFVVSTDEQNRILSEQFEKYTPHRPKIATIPVGSLDDLKSPKEGRIPYSMLTASRLAGEKHIDWLVKAVVKAKKLLPELRLDIYGEGGEKEKLEKLIEEYKAQDYIFLKGHANLENVYSNYELYLTASTSEGFGLTLMEAIGSGLPMIGFDVRYGNKTFIKEGGNGYLIPIGEDSVDDEIATEFAARIVAIYENQQIEKMSKNSYLIAEHFLTSHVETAWKNLISEVTK